MDSSTEYTEEYSYDSEVSDGQEDWSELCAFVKYNEKMKRDGPALIYIADNYIFTSYKDGKCEKGYTLHGRNGLSEIRYENNEITNVKVVEVNSGVLRDPTNTFEFNGYIAGESPMGLGVCKDLATDEVVYKGIMIGWERNIEGISVKDNKKIYRGSWCANKRCGFGIEYDEKEMILREGYWFNDEFIKSGLFLASPLNSSMSKWKVNNSVCSEVLYLSGFQALEDVTFDSKSFETVGTVNISGLRKLRSIEFESKSFSMFGYSNPKRRFSVSDCPSLKTIIIEKYSFTDYTQFELSQLDSLEVIKIGSLDSDSFNFYEASFCIQNLPNLRVIHLGNNAFIYSRHTVFKNLTSLTEIILGDCALQGPNTDDCSLEMYNLPVLARFSSLGHSFWHVKHAVLKDLPHECDVQLPRSFRHCSDIQYTNVAFQLP